jgi:hypothetical protein
MSLRQGGLLESAVKFDNFKTKCNFEHSTIRSADDAARLAFGSARGLVLIQWQAAGLSLIDGVT